MFLQRKNTYGVRYSRAEGMPLIELGEDENSMPKQDKVYFMQYAYVNEPGKTSLMSTRFEFSVTSRNYNDYTHPL